MKTYITYALCAIALAACAASSLPPDCDGGVAGGGGFGRPPECEHDMDCAVESDICTKPTCSDGACVVVPLKDGTACGIASVCLMNGNCVCKGCVDVNGDCNAGDSPLACGVAPPGFVSVSCDVCHGDCVAGSCI